MQTLNKKQPYSKREAEDGRKWYCQNGLEYKLDGTPMDKKAVIARANQTAAEIQEQADVAMEAAKQAQVDANAAIEALGVGEPSSVAELTAALERAEIEIPAGSLKADLEQLWAAHQAA
jgi:hypothetical protein